MDKESFALEDFKNIQELIKFIDQKAGIILVIYGFLFTAFLEVVKNIPIKNPFSLHIPMMITYLVCYFSGVLFIAFSIFQIYYVIFKIIQPRYASNYGINEKCLYYFGHISSLTRNEFKQKFKQLHPDKILDELLGQIYEVSNILKVKQKNFCFSTKFVFICIICLIAFGLSSRFL